MLNINRWILVMILWLPAYGWSSDLRFELDVDVSVTERKITGTARLKADANKKVNLSVENLRKLKVDGIAVSDAGGKSISLTVQNDKETLISYEALFLDKKNNIIDPDNVFLTEGWYPRPDVLAEYALSVTLPKKFIATSEAESVIVRNHGETKTFKFQFNHPLDALHLAASTRYVLKKDLYNNIAIEAYFFKEDEKLADTYIAYTKKYLAMYEAMLTPYPYHRFAIVENILPTGNSMPTYTLLGNQVVRLPFIVKTSLGHEILHQWFGNSVYIDFAHGNWAEGITAYLADHHYAALEGDGAAYRKQIMVNYSAYVNPDNAMPVTDFYSRLDKAQSAIGYGKVAMIFHGLQNRYGDKLFYTALQEFIRQNSYREASWHDIQRAFEKVTGETLYAYFGQWLSGRDIPKISVEDSELRVDQGQLKLNFTVLQQDEVYPLRIPVTLYTDSGKMLQMVDVKDSVEPISLTLEEPPHTVVIDENYELMRELAPEEIPPVLASIMGKEKLTVVVSARQRDRYQPLVRGLGVKNVAYAKPDDVTFAQMSENSFLIAGYDNTFVDMLLGKQVIPKDDVRVKVFKNPYNTTERIALLHAKTKAAAKLVEPKLMHYGKYTDLAFREGKIIYKTISETINGINVLSMPATKALKPDKLATLNDIIPGLEACRIIYVGERHDKFSHHINQLLVIKKLHDAGYKLAVGMEMFQRPYQNVLNDYLAERIDERTFLQKSEYFTNWRYNYYLYKPIIDYLKQQDIPLVALNIKGDVSRKVAREGIKSLPGNKKKQLPGSMNFSNERYRVDLNEVFVLHTQQKELENFNYFFQAQTLWDEVMAESAHQFLINNPEHKLVILAGNGHVRRKYGIPERLYRRNNEPFVVVVQDEEMEEDIADYILLTTEMTGTEPPRLGVTVEEKEQGLTVTGVAHKGPAKKAGLQEGDVVMQVAGQPITSLADLKLALFYSEIGSRQKIEIKRGDKTLAKEIEFFQFTHF